MPFVRSFNPIWFEVDLTALPFDDTYFLFVLQNTFPYLPAIVYHDPSGLIPWNNPIQFLANGTLPVDIYWDTGSSAAPMVYRLEFRKGDDQSDPLIYLVENYTPGSGGIGPITQVASISDNQITNPQFSLIDFTTPFSYTGAASGVSPIDVAPGWSLLLTGTGTVTLTQVPLNDSPSTINPTNAPYALEINTSSWGSVVLRQRFQQNGMEWANQTVAVSITALIQGAPQVITATLVDSNSTLLATVLTATVDGVFNEYRGFGTLGGTTNPDLPPAAYVDFLIQLPITGNVFITSIQLVVSNMPTVVPYIQDTIERQQDYTFHYYRNSLLTEPKESLLTGWDFGLNPWQFTTVTNTTLASQCAYTADQTIIYQQTGASQVSTAQGTAAQNFAFQVTAVTANNRFAMIQYIDPRTIRDVWGYTLSSLVRAYILSPTHSSSVRFKMRLIWRTTLPSTIGSAEPISSWTGAGDPVFAAGWTAITPTNDPIYTFGAQGSTYSFQGMTLPANQTGTMTLGIVIYTIDNMNQAATADSILFERVSLCRNDFALDAQILTFDETLKRCYYYFESSKNLGVLLTTSDASGALVRTCNVFTSGGNIVVFPRSFDIRYNEVKRTNASLVFYNEAGLINNVSVYIRDNAVQIGATTEIVTTGWNSANNGNKGVQFISVTQTASPFASVAGSVSNSTDAYISFHYSADSRMGT
ncbi:hypothetical protein [Pedobacter sp.]|jgi:hypothetical protein|uniref:hypothetical protein n=1 Tax=Pedobacter sp. TaxID=1411316 RepID=UPI002C3653DE|nr:hypothetical protein [Pedobacter sp.]HWW39681.1 hypothetical protein [Pedobacter sp.]